LPGAGHDGPDPETELVDQVVSHERVVEATGAAHRSGASMTPSSETRVDSISLRIAVLFLEL
jgi:hypothetical protein